MIVGTMWRHEAIADVAVSSHQITVFFYEERDEARPIQFGSKSKQRWRSLLICIYPSHHLNVQYLQFHGRPSFLPLQLPEHVHVADVNPLQL